MTRQKDAKLRVCTSCEWIFKEGEILSSSLGGCPKCGFAHYGARFLYGDKCYQYARTQKPWIDRKVLDYHLKLIDEIKGRGKVIVTTEAPSSNG